MGKWRRRAVLPRAELCPGSDLANRRNVWMFFFLPPRLAESGGLAPQSVARPVCFRNSVRASADSLSKMAEDGRHARQSVFTDPTHFRCGLGLAQFVLQNGPRGGRSVPCTRSGAPKVRGKAPSFARRNESIAPAVARRSRAMAGRPAASSFGGMRSDN